MDDDVLRLEFGNGALGPEEKGCLFRAVSGICIDKFGPEDPVMSLRNSLEIVNIDGSYVKISRLVIRNLGIIIGSIIELEYFDPINEPYNERLADLYDEDSEEQDDDISYSGKHVAMTFDTSDGSFFRTESLSKLYIDEIGEADIDDLEVYDAVDDEPSHDVFDALLSDEATTPTIDDFFIVNTVKAVLAQRS